MVSCVFLFFIVNRNQFKSKSIRFDKTHNSVGLHTSDSFKCVQCSDRPSSILRERNRKPYQLGWPVSQPREREQNRERATSVRENQHAVVCIWSERQRDASCDHWLTRASFAKAFFSCFSLPVRVYLFFFAMHCARYSFSLLFVSFWFWLFVSADNANSDVSVNSCFLFSFLLPVDCPLTALTLNVRTKECEWECECE